MFTARYGLNLRVMYINPANPSGHYMYRLLNIHKFYVLSTQCICFVWIWEQTAITSLYSINWLVLITETECVYRALRTGSLYIIELSYAICTSNLHTVSALHPHYCTTTFINMLQAPQRHSRTKDRSILFYTQTARKVYFSLISKTHAIFQQFKGVIMYFELSNTIISQNDIMASVSPHSSP